MRTTFSILLLALVGLVISLAHVQSERKELMARLVHETDLLRLRQAELSGAQRQLAECSSNLHVSSVSIDELRSRGSVVATADAWIELLCVPAPDRAFDPSRPLALSTKIQLSTPTGFYTFVTRRLEPLNLVTDEQHQFHIILSYEPLNMNEVIGRPIDDFAAVNLLTTHFNDVLHAAGLRLAPDGIRAFVFNINGLEAVRIEGFHADADPPGDLPWDVSKSFDHLVPTYTAALQAKIAQRAESQAPTTLQH
jgi:hypothetical protein